MEKKANSPKRILCIVGSMNVGGAETFLMKVYRSLDRDRYQMDFCVCGPGVYDKEIISLGGKVFFYTPKTKNRKQSSLELTKIVRENHYKNILRISQNAVSSLDLKAAKKGGATNLIFRSSNSNSCGRKKEQILHFLFRPFLLKTATQLIAPSSESASFMFGKRFLENPKFHFVRNGIDYNQFSFSPGRRKTIREELGCVEDTMVFLHVGRFQRQKNHVFLMNVFKRFYEENPNARLWLFGDGDETIKNEIRKFVANNGLEHAVVLFGVVSNINDYFSAADCFLLPSFFEGMPNTVIEAQASGIESIVSSTITPECKITDLVHFAHVNDCDEWIDKMRAVSISENRKNTFPCFVDAGYSLPEELPLITRIFYNEE